MTTQYDAAQVIHPLHVARQAGLVGATTAVPGIITGAVYGTLRTRTPILFSLFSGAQCFAIGSTFWTLRSAILSSTALQNWYHTTRGLPLLPVSPPTPQETTRASVLAGALTGSSLGLAFRGPRNVIPGTIMFSLFGWAGQKVYDVLDRRNTVQVVQRKEVEEGTREPEKNFLQRMAEKKWSPFSILTDEEYEKMMGEKLLVLEADIALIDDKIKGLRELQKQMAARGEKGKIEGKK